jgi:hypothetical protein
MTSLEKIMALTPKTLTPAELKSLTAAEFHVYEIAWLRSRLDHAERTGEGYSPAALRQWLAEATAAPRPPP